MMSTKNLIYYLKNPTRLAEISYQQLEELIRQYPYCQNFRYLLAQKSKLEQHKSYKEDLEIAATYSIDRTLLHRQLFFNIIQPEQLEESFVLSESDQLELKELSKIKDNELDDRIPIILEQVSDTKAGEKLLPEIPLELPFLSDDIEETADALIVPDLQEDIVKEMEENEEAFVVADLQQDAIDEIDAPLVVPDLHQDIEEEVIAEASNEPNIASEIDVPSENIPPIELELDPLATDIPEASAPMVEEKTDLIVREPILDTSPPALEENLDKIEDDLEEDPDAEVVIGGSPNEEIVESPKSNVLDNKTSASEEKEEQEAAPSEELTEAPEMSLFDEILAEDIGDAEEHYEEQERLRRAELEKQRPSYNDNFVDEILAEDIGDAEEHYEEEERLRRAELEKQRPTYSNSIIDEILADDTEEDVLELQDSTFDPTDDKSLKDDIPIIDIDDDAEEMEEMDKILAEEEMPLAEANRASDQEHPIVDKAEPQDVMPEEALPPSEGDMSLAPKEIAPDAYAPEEEDFYEEDEDEDYDEEYDYENRPIIRKGPKEFIDSDLYLDGEGVGVINYGDDYRDAEEPGKPQENGVEPNSLLEKITDSYASDSGDEEHPLDKLLRDIDDDEEDNPYSPNFNKERYPELHRLMQEKEEAEHMMNRRMEEMEEERERKKEFQKVWESNTPLPKESFNSWLKRLAARNRPEEEEDEKKEISNDSWGLRRRSIFLDMDMGHDLFPLRDDFSFNDNDNDYEQEDHYEEDYDYEGEDQETSSELENKNIESPVPQEQIEQFQEEEELSTDNNLEITTPPEEAQDTDSVLQPGKRNKKIKKLIKANKKKKKKKKKEKPKNPIAAKSIRESEDILSETLADLLASQGYSDKAIDMYKRLSLIFPKKSDFFARKIEELQFFNPKK